MDPLTFWFLDAVVGGRLPLPELVAPHLELALNRPGHGLSFGGVAAALEQFATAGLIDFHRWGERGESSPVPASPDLIAEGLKRRGSDLVFYGLTAEGGRRWEQYAKPDWALYVDDWVTTEPNVGEVTAATREAAEAEFALHIPEHAVRPNSRTDEALGPWAATYWKTLPAGYRIRYAFDWREATPREWAAWRKRAEAQPRWYTPPTLGG